MADKYVDQFQNTITGSVEKVKDAEAREQIDTLNTSLTNVQNDVTSLNETLTESNITNMVLNYRGESIPSSSDLNDYIKCGKYYSLTSSISSTLENCPFTGGGFSLYVFAQASGGNLNQIITGNFSSPRIYYRLYDASSQTFRDWAMISYETV